MCPCVVCGVARTRLSCDKGGLADVLRGDYLSVSQCRDRCPGSGKLPEVSCSGEQGSDVTPAEFPSRLDMEASCVF